MTIIDCPECKGTGQTLIKSKLSGPHYHGHNLGRCWICQGARQIVQPVAGERSWPALRHPECVAEMEEAS